MPHSSGGGSHGGGAHHGGSRHGSSGSGGRGSSGPRISKRQYPGAARYVYYNRRSKHPEYFYCSGTPMGGNFLLAGILTALTCLVAFILLVTVAVGTIHIPMKVSPAADRELQILGEEDLLGSDKERQELLREMEEFQNKTGVTPAVEVVRNSKWNHDYYSVGTFAYSEYLRIFDDEKHWLFVISYPDRLKKDGFVNWEWEGMIGDEVERCINEGGEEKFCGIIQKMLIRFGEESPAKAMAEAFHNYNAIVMKPVVDQKQFFLGMLINIPGVLILGFLTFSVRRRKKFSHSVRVEPFAPECVCEYCRGIYVRGTVTSCPHCGAEIPPLASERNP